MYRHSKGVASIIVCIRKLQDPYRQNAIEWLRSRTNHPLEVLYLDLENFLEGLNPLVRHYFIHDTVRVLELAVKHFGIGPSRRDWDQKEDLQPDPRRRFLLGWEDFHENWRGAWPSNSESSRKLGI